MVGVNMKYAIIKDGKVVNIAAATPEFAASQGWVDCPDEVGIGWSFDGGVLSPPQRDINSEWNAVRSRRNALLLASDWTQNADTPQLVKDKWSSYRQTLRDIPQTFTDPAEVIWPTQPE